MLIIPKNRHWSSMLKRSLLASARPKIRKFKNQKRNVKSALKLPAFRFKILKVGKKFEKTDKILLDKKIIIKYKLANKKKENKLLANI
ncbi:hypothetical protein BpHYR1_014525 [Brachionus plicatilis]|uniref:Uncharacterized protein n=1 Tax=Brachionus plicatilis TaxID=10195 RepID=A0A3M7QC03_BRAPC|nr:hypothetical protein BpHYR1_014525 [Brachionus plicatilis]